MRLDGIEDVVHLATRHRKTSQGLLAALVKFWARPTRGLEAAPASLISYVFKRRVYRTVGDSARSCGVIDVPSAPGEKMTSARAAIAGPTAESCKAVIAPARDKGQG